MSAWALSLVLAVGGQVAKSGDAPVQFDTLKDPDLVPLALRNEIRDALPASLVGEGHPAKVVGNELRIDTKGNGSFDVSVTRTFQIVRVKAAARDVDVAVFRLADTWFAAPARVGRARIGRHAFELLDVDSNGALSSGDFVRIDDGAFQRETARHLLCGGDLLFEFEVPAAPAPVLRWHVVEKPAWANALQWSGFMTVAALRGQHGLAPLALDEALSRGCQLHAEYLYLNDYDYSKPWDGVGSHGEKSDAAGYTEEGSKAGSSCSTEGDPDPPSVARQLFGAMIHRPTLLGEEHLGIGAVDRSKNSSASGYTVMGGPDRKVETLEDIAVVPAPGSIGVPLKIEVERPAPENPPQFYSRPRGYPVSVTYGTLPLEDPELELFEGVHPKRVVGTTFTPKHPIHSTRPNNAESVFLAPDGVLRPNELYEVRFRFRLGGISRMLAWRFHTGKQ
jgi:hypothetical protein